MTICVSGTSSRDHPEGHSLMPPILLLASSGPSFCSPTGAGVRAALIRRSIHSPERGPCRHHTAIKRPGGCNGEDPSLSLAALHPSLSLVSGASLGACDCWAGPASWAAGGTQGCKTAASTAAPTEARQPCLLSASGACSSVSQYSQLPTVPELWGPSKDAN